MSSTWSRGGQAGREIIALDQAVYDAVHAVPSPTLDHAIARLSRASNHSKLWVGTAALMSLLGPRPRRAAAVGLASVAVTSAVVNVAIKPVFRRRRPLREETVRTHVVRMPTSASYPSGHSASAFAFSTAVGSGVPEIDTLLRVLASAVAYSRVHTGVHYPGDVIVGAAVGAGIGTLMRHFTERLTASAPAPAIAPSLPRPAA